MYQSFDPTPVEPSIPPSQTEVKRVFSLTPILIVALVGILLVTFYWFFLKNKTSSSDLDLRNESQSSQEAEAYSQIPEVAFIEEVYQTIADNYWQQLSDEQLSQLFFNSFARVAGTQPELSKKNREGVAQLVKKIIKDKSDQEKEQLLA